MGSTVDTPTFSATPTAATPEPVSATPPPKFAYKQCPPVDPMFYCAWASDVQLAFMEREWTDYLIPPDGNDKDEKFIADARTALNARVFLSQAIPFQYRAGMEH